MSTPVDAPVWILAAPFSGASWLAGCLGSHPDLFATPELNLFMAPTVGELLDIFDIGQGAHAHGLLRALAELEFGNQSDAGIACARAWLEERSFMPTGQVALHLAARAAPRRLVVPDSESSLRPMDLQRLGEQIPGAGVVHLVRHPWEQGCLLAAWARERLFVPQDYKDHAFRPPQVEPQIPWLRSNTNIERLLQRLPAGQQLRLRDEDLSETSAAGLPELCRWLGLKSDDATLQSMSDPHEWTFAGYGPGTAPYGLEPEVLEPFRDDDLELAASTTLMGPMPWQAEPEGLDAQVVHLARRYGYT